MGFESKEAKEYEEVTEALLGTRKKSQLPYPEKSEFKVFVGCLDNKADRDMYESLLTKSYRCQNKLKNPGDLAMLTLHNTFDKEGYFHVVARYVILPE